MHEAAKAPLLPTCHDSARKHESIVYQFHNICSWGCVVSHLFGGRSFGLFVAIDESEYLDASAYIARSRMGKLTDELHVVVVMLM